MLADEHLFLAFINLVVKACWHQPGWHLKKLWLDLVIFQTPKLECCYMLRLIVTRLVF